MMIIDKRKVKNKATKKKLTIKEVCKTSSSSRSLMEHLISWIFTRSRLEPKRDSKLLAIFAYDVLSCLFMIIRVWRVAI